MKLKIGLLKKYTAGAVMACMSVMWGSGCTKTAGAQMKDGLQTVERERDPQRLRHAGEAYALLGDFTRAAQYFALAIESGGDEVQLFPRLLEVCVRDKQYRAAIYYGQNFLRKHPNDHSLRFVLANLYGAMGDTKMARDQIEEVLVSLPDSPDAHYALAVLLRDEQGDREGADVHFRAYLAALPEGVHSEEARASLLKRVP